MKVTENCVFKVVPTSVSSYSSNLINFIVKEVNIKLKLHLKYVKKNNRILLAIKLKKHKNKCLKIEQKIDKNTKSKQKYFN